MGNEITASTNETSEIQPVVNSDGPESALPEQAPATQTYIQASQRFAQRITNYAGFKQELAAIVGNDVEIILAQRAAQRAAARNAVEAAYKESKNHVQLQKGRLKLGSYQGNENQELVRQHRNRDITYEEYIVKASVLSALHQLEIFAAREAEACDYCMDDRGNVVTNRFGQPEAKKAASPLKTAAEESFSTGGLLGKLTAGFQWAVTPLQRIAAGAAALMERSPQ
jgi:hypothetical protein